MAQECFPTRYLRSISFRLFILAFVALVGLSVSCHDRREDPRDANAGGGPNASGKLTVSSAAPTEKLVEPEKARQGTARDVDLLSPQAVAARDYEMARECFWLHEIFFPSRFFDIASSSNLPRRPDASGQADWSTRPQLSSRNPLRPPTESSRLYMNDTLTSQFIAHPSSGELGSRAFTPVVRPWGAIPLDPFGAPRLFFFLLWEGPCIIAGEPLSRFASG